MNKFIGDFLRYNIEITDAKTFKPKNTLTSTNIIKFIEQYHDTKIKTKLLAMYKDNKTLFLRTFKELYLLKYTKYKLMAKHDSLFLRKNGSNVKFQKNKPMTIKKIHYFGTQMAAQHLYKDKFWDDITNKNVLYYNCYLILRIALLHLFKLIEPEEDKLTESVKPQSNKLKYKLKKIKDKMKFSTETKKLKDNTIKLEYLEEFKTILLDKVFYIQLQPGSNNTDNKFIPPQI